MVDCPVPPAKLKLYDALIELYPDVDRKGAKCPYTSMNGNMFSFIKADGTMAMRMGADEREAFIKTYRSKLAVHYNTVMKEYVDVPAGLLKKTAELKREFDKSVAYARTLKAKPTTRKKPAAKKTVKKKPAAKKTSKKAGTKAVVKKKTSKKAAARKTSKKAPKKSASKTTAVRKKTR